SLRASNDTQQVGRQGTEAHRGRPTGNGSRSILSSAAPAASERGAPTRRSAHRERCRKRWLASGLEHCLVQEMNDGGMGSLRFVDDGQTDRRFGAAFAEGRFFDEGGVPVSVVLKPG